MKFALTGVFMLAVLLMSSSPSGGQERQNPRDFLWISSSSTKSERSKLSIADAAPYV